MIRSQIQQICQLQREYSPENTPAMRRRGDIVRNEIRAELEALKPQLDVALNEFFQGTLSFEGRDGTGRKTHIPWHRAYVKELSPSAQEGWYIVYLFKADGSGAYLCLSHGSTRFDGSSFVPRPDSELTALVDFAHSALSDKTEGDPRLVYEIDLAHSGSLGKAYPKSTAFAYYYPAESIPDQASLQSDLIRFIEWLGLLYRQVELGRAPTAKSPERSAMETAISPLSGRGQGRGLTGPERRAVELHAMQLATAHLKSLGYSVSDVSAKQSFDLEATRGGEVLSVEVKGTTGTPSSILMTANEVALHQDRYPQNALVVVHDIGLVRGAEPTASGGTLEYRQPWALQASQIRPIAYEIKDPLAPESPMKSG